MFLLILVILFFFFYSHLVWTKKKVAQAKKKPITRIVFTEARWDDMIDDKRGLRMDGTGKLLHSVLSYFSFPISVNYIIPMGGAPFTISFGMFRVKLYRQSPLPPLFFSWPPLSKDGYKSMRKVWSLLEQRNKKGKKKLFTFSRFYESTQLFNFQSNKF